MLKVFTLNGNAKEEEGMDITGLDNMHDHIK